MGDGTENLVPFQGGFDPRRARGKGRPPILGSQEEIDSFAAMVCEGLTNKELAENFNCGERTAQQYKKDPRIKAACLKFIEDRTIRITRKTDAIIEQRLIEAANEMDVETLLKIRKEFLGGALRAQTTGDAKDGATINDAAEAMEQDPDLAAELQEILARAGQRAVVDEE